MQILLESVKKLVTALYNAVILIALILLIHSERGRYPGVLIRSQRCGNRPRGVSGIGSGGLWDRVGILVDISFL